MLKLQREVARISLRTYPTVKEITILNIGQHFPKLCLKIACYRLMVYIRKPNLVLVQAYRVAIL